MTEVCGARLPADEGLQKPAAERAVPSVPEIADAEASCWLGEVAGAVSFKQDANQTCSTRRPNSGTKPTLDENVRLTDVTELKP